MSNAKKTIKVIWDYPCFPIWIYDENNELIDNVLPDELIGNAEFKSLCDNLQSQYNSLFVNNEAEFKYVGFKDEQARDSFCKDVNKMNNILLKRLNGCYNIEIKLPNV